MGIVKAVCISEQKGTAKKNIGKCKLIENWGLEKDAHAGNWHRQVSLLSYEAVEAFKARGAKVKDGAFGENAFIDIGLDSLVRSYEDAENERQRRYAADKAAETANAPKSRYNSILDELQNLNDAIEDGPLSEKIDKIQAVTAKIFNVVEEKPEKVSEIRKFMDYYLPTTLKLLRSYATLESQGIEGDNINSAKGDIDRILDTLSHGFEQQLDQLFKADALDISSDIDVLESMMEQDGLSGENPFGQQMGGH